LLAGQRMCYPVCSRTPLCRSRHRLPLIHSASAFTAVTSIATIGLYISYVIPTFLRLTIGRQNFVPGASGPITCRPMTQFSPRRPQCRGGAGLQVVKRSCVLWKVVPQGPATSTHYNLITQSQQVYTARDAMSVLGSVQVLACVPRDKPAFCVCAGPFHLGKFTYPIGILGIIWVCFITALFVLPTVRCFALILRSVDSCFAVQPHSRIKCTGLSGCA
jgi:hypothetical protein